MESEDSAVDEDCMTQDASAVRPRKILDKDALTPLDKRVIVVLFGERDFRGNITGWEADPGNGATPYTYKSLNLETLGAANFQELRDSVMKVSDALGLKDSVEAQEEGPNVAIVTTTVTNVFAGIGAENIAIIAGIKRELAEGQRRDGGAGQGWQR